MIITVTMNPAIDKTVEIEQLVPNGLNRIQKVEYDAGGKGINVSKTIHELGGESLAMGFLGGNAGKTIENVLTSWNIQHDFIWVEGETRTNTKVFEKSGGVTELNEPGPVINEAQVEELIQKMSEDTYLVEGSMKLDDINDVLGTNLTSEDYDSIGGLIIDCLDRLPEDGEEVTLENGIHLKVQGIDQNRIIKVLMTIPEPNEEHVEHSSETSENHE